MAAPDSLVVNEVFGPTFQGEGPSLGRRAGFVRLGRCDLTCAWCDTPYTWDWKGRNGVVFDPSVELRRRSVLDLVQAVDSMDVGLVVVTGGEPLLQRRGVEALVAALHERSCDVEIETNGRHLPLTVASGRVAHNVSPKLASSGVRYDERIRPDVLRAHVEAGSAFKFVCGEVSELDEVARLVEVADLPASQVWISPLGTDAATISRSLRDLADPVVARGWNLTTRLHTLCWGDERRR